MRILTESLLAFFRAMLLALHCLWALACLSLVELYDYETSTYTLLYEAEYLVPCVAHLLLHFLMGHYALREGVARTYYLRVAGEVVLCLLLLPMLQWSFRYRDPFALLCAALGFSCIVAPVVHWFLPVRPREPESPLC